MNQPVPERIPHHVAIIMDGNGRWARQRGKKRVMGHKAGMERARGVAEYCSQRGVKVLTLFAFSSENWQRPEEEVSFLMELFASSLNNESRKLHKNNVRLKVIGDHGRFDRSLREAIVRAEALTGNNDGLTLLIAANYGGRWDILQAARRLSAAGTEFTEEALAGQLTTDGCPDPDLVIRTGGEMRISNFLLWQSAYSELYFADELWPDFDEEAMARALDEYARRERRFGKTGEQLKS